MRVKEDLLRGSSSGYDLSSQEITRVFQVWDLGAFNNNIKIAQALIAVDGIDPTIYIPQMTTQYPDPALTNFVVVNVRTGPDVTHDVIDVFVTYRYRYFAGGFLKSYSGALTTVPIAAQKAGTGLNLGKDVPVTLFYTATGGTRSVSKQVFIDGILLGGTFSYQRMEHLDPEYFNTQFAGSVNWLPWRGYAARQLMVLPIQGGTEDNYWYNNHYTFLFKEETHDKYVLYYLEDGSIPPEVAADIVYDGSKTSGNGWERVPARYQIDFAQLFPWIPNVPPSDNGFPKSAVFHEWGV